MLLITSIHPTYNSSGLNNFRSQSQLLFVLHACKWSLPDINIVNFVMVASPVVAFFANVLMQAHIGELRSFFEYTPNHLFYFEHRSRESEQSRARTKVEDECQERPFHDVPQTEAQHKY